MAKPVGVCPSCEQLVEWTAVATAAGIVHRCNNCWHHLDDAQVKQLGKLQEELAAIEEKRNAALAAYR